MCRLIWAHTSLCAFSSCYSYCCFSFVFSGNLHLRHLPTHNSRELLRKYSKINWIWVWLLNCKNTNKGLNLFMFERHGCATSLQKITIQHWTLKQPIHRVREFSLWTLKNIYEHITDQITKRDSKLNAFHFFSLCKLGITDINLMLWTVLWLFYERTMCNVNLTEWEKAKITLLLNLNQVCQFACDLPCWSPPPVLLVYTKVAHTCAQVVFVVIVHIFVLLRMQDQFQSTTGTYMQYTENIAISVLDEFLPTMAVLT